MNYDILSYILIGSFFTAVMVPLIVLLRKSVREEKRLRESETTKKSDTPQQQKKELVY
jgi:hypothetical protein